MQADAYESGNTLWTASVLAEGSGSIEDLTLTRGDRDYFKLTLNGEGTVDDYVQALFQYAEGNLNLEIYDAGGKFVRGSYAVTDNERLSLENLDAGDYYVKVYGRRGATINYSLEWDTKHVKPGFAHSEFVLADGDMAYVVGTDSLDESSFDIHRKYCEGDGATVIDAEKTFATHGDDNLCWAATLSNMLAWTGWGRKCLGSENLDKAEDVIFRTFMDNFEDGRSAFEYGVNWFFTGEYDALGVPGWAQPTGPGNYIGVSADPYTDDLHSVSASDGRAMVTTKEMDALGSYLDRGASSYVSIGWYTGEGETSRCGGHSVTCWGYTCDPAQTKGSEEYYTGLIVSNSDDSKYECADPMEAPDTLQILDLTWSDIWGCYYIARDDYSSFYEGKIERLGILLPEDVSALGVAGADSCEVPEMPL